MTAPSNPLFGRKSALIFVLCFLPIFALIYAFSDAGRALAAAVGAIAVGGVCLSYRDRWGHLWFWTVIAGLILAHVALVALLTLHFENSFGPALSGAALIDMAICFGVVALFDKFMNKQTPPASD